MRGIISKFDVIDSLVGGVRKTTTGTYAPRRGRYLLRCGWALYLYTLYSVRTADFGRVSSSLRLDAASSGRRIRAIAGSRAYRLLRQVPLEQTVGQLLARLVAQHKYHHGVVRFSSLSENIKVQNLQHLAPKSDS